MPRTLVLCFGWLMLLSACPGTIDDPDRFLIANQRGDTTAIGSCPVDVETQLLPARCAGSGCHDSRSVAAGLDLVSGGVADRLVGVTSLCDDLPLVDPTVEAEASYFIEKVSVEQPACGSKMPLARKALTEGERSCLIEWVDRMTSANSDTQAAASDGGAEGEG